MEVDHTPAKIAGKVDVGPSEGKDPKPSLVASNGNGFANGTTNGHHGSSSSTSNGTPPSIPHITTNIIPLSNILKFYSQESYKQLTTIIENLSTNQSTELDSKRKSQLLQVIISLRQDFLKVYTLVKWASVSKDVGKLIDLLNWFRIQDSFFENLAYGINELNRFSGAKLPNPDLITSIEVLVQGRPQLPSYNIIPSAKISSGKILKVLKDLNLVLTTRMALINGDDEGIPSRLLSNYEVRDGRIYFTIPNEFQVSISVANDTIIYDHQDKEEYSKSPFYFVDFKFLFGINPETLLITHDESKSASGGPGSGNGATITKLPRASFANLEKIANQTLLTSGLKGLYELLHRYSISFKLYLISRQLRDLAINSKWRGNIQYQYQKSLIIINYWSSQYLSKGWKSFIELGVDKGYNLNFRWFKNGKYVENHGIEGVFQKKVPADVEVSSSPQPSDESSSPSYEDLSVEMILNLIAHKHSEGIIQRIYTKLNEVLGAENDGIKELENEEGQLSEVVAPASSTSSPCSMINPHQLLIKLTPSKSTVFAINPLTGFFYFIDPSPIQQQSTRLINSIPPLKQSSIASKFISEREMIDHIINQLFHLRLETFKGEINNKLITTEWIPNDLITLNDYETSKLFNFLSNENQTHRSNKIQFYRRKNWPSSWFLLNLISGVNFKSYWWVARIKSIKGEWKIQWVEKIKEDEATSNENNVTYQFCHDLSTKCSNMIIDHIILEELLARRIKFVKISNKEAVFAKFDLKEPKKVKSEDEAEQEVIYESMIGLYNRDLIPLENSSTMIILKVELIHHSVNGSMMKLSLFGKLRNFKLKEHLSNEIKIKLEDDLFVVSDEIAMNQAIGSSTTTKNAGVNNNANSNESFLSKLFQNLSKLDNLIKIINQLNEFYSNDQIKTLSLNQVEFFLDEEFGSMTVDIEDSGISLTTNSNCAPFQILISYLNHYLKSDNDGASIAGVIKYLQQFLPTLKTLTSMKSKFTEEQKTKPKLNNGITKVNFDIAFRSFDSSQINLTINSFQPQSKKINRDKIAFDISIKTNKFFKGGNQLLYLVSYKGNFANPASIKYKKLFESIYTGVNELPSDKYIKLNHDILLTDPTNLGKVLDIIRESCLTVLNEL